MMFRRRAVHVTLVNYPTLALGKRLLGVGIAYAAYMRMMFLPQVGRVVYDVFPFRRSGLCICPVLVQQCSSVG
jgi:NO-binding membrane sensor protein with MHYT domain